MELQALQHGVDVLDDGGCCVHSSVVEFIARVLLRHYLASREGGEACSSVARSQSSSFRLGSVYSPDSSGEREGPQVSRAPGDLEVDDRIAPPYAASSANGNDKNDEIDVIEATGARFLSHKHPSIHPCKDFQTIEEIYSQEADNITIIDPSIDPSIDRSVDMIDQQEPLDDSQESVEQIAAVKGDAEAQKGIILRGAECDVSTSVASQGHDISMPSQMRQQGGSDQSSKPSIDQSIEGIDHNLGINRRTSTQNAIEVRIKSISTQIDATHCTKAEASCPGV